MIKSKFIDIALVDLSLNKGAIIGIIVGIIIIGVIVGYSAGTESVETQVEINEEGETETQGRHITIELSDGLIFSEAP